MAYTSLAGSGVGGAYAVDDPFGVETVDLIRTNLDDLDTRVSDLEDGLVADGAVQWAQVAIASAAALAIRATPVTLVAAPGAGKIAEFLGMVLILDATATAYVEGGNNLAVRYENGSGAKVSDDIEATGFADQTADTMTTARPKADAIVAKTVCENKALVLHNIGGSEWTTGTGVFRAKVAYRVIPSGW